MSSCPLLLQPLPHSGRGWGKNECGIEIGEARACKIICRDMTPPDRAKGIIDLKGVHFGPKIPKRLKLWKHCSLALRSPAPGVVSFGFGPRTRPEFLAAARKHAVATASDDRYRRRRSPANAVTSDPLRRARDASAAQRRSAFKPRPRHCGRYFSICRRRESAAIAKRTIERPDGAEPRLQGQGEDRARLDSRARWSSADR
jgi:hypothetical protein